MPLAGTEVTISLHSGIGWRRTAIGFEAGNAIEVAAPQVSLHMDCNAVPPGPLLNFITSVTLHLSWELLTGRYGEDSGGGGGARLCDVETGDWYEVLWQLEEHSSSKVGTVKGPPFAIFVHLRRLWSSWDFPRQTTLHFDHFERLTAA